MASDLPDAEETELVEWTPQSAECVDGAAVIGDLAEFMIDTDSVAVCMRDGAMFVLRRKTLKWMNVEDIRKEDKKPSVRAIRDRQST